MLAVGYAVSGPLTMHRAGFAVSVPVTLAVATAANVAMATLPIAEARARYGVVAAAVGLMAMTGTTIAALWLGAGVVAAGVVIRRSPVWPGLSGAHPSLVVPVSVLLAFAAWRADATLYRYGPAPYILGAGIVILFGVSIRASWRAYALWALGTIVLFTGAATGRHVYNLFAATVPVVVAAFALMAWSARRGEAGAFRPWHALGPMALAGPAALWWMVNVGVVVDGYLLSDRQGFGAWQAFVTRLPVRFHTIDAYTGVPTLLVALVATGAFVTVLGRRGAQAVALGVAGATLGGACIAATWQIGLT